MQKAEQEKTHLEKEVASAAIVAPHEGIVVGLVEAKAEVSAGQVLARIQDISLLKATLKISEGDAHLLQNEQPISLSAPNLPRQEFKGRISVVASAEHHDGAFEAIINNPERLSLDPNGKATIHCGKQSLWKLGMLRVKRLTIPALHAALR
jgi:hypothetical protein